MAPLAPLATPMCATEMITIWFAGWISSRIASLQPDTDIQKLLLNGNRIRIRISQNAFVDISRIQTFGKTCTLHNHSFIIFRSIFSAFCAMTPNLSMVQSLYRNGIPSPLNLLIGHAQFVSMNLFLCGKIGLFQQPIHSGRCLLRTYTWPRWARTGLDRTGSGLEPILAGSGLDRTATLWKLADRTGSDWENFRCFNVNILKISQILVVIRFHRFVKW